MSDPFKGNPAKPDVATPHSSASRLAEYNASNPAKSQITNWVADSDAPKGSGSVKNVFASKLPRK